MDLGVTIHEECKVELIWLEEPLQGGYKALKL